MILRTSIARALAWLGIIERPEFLVSTALDMPAPEELLPGLAVVVGPNERPKWVTFACPSGCGTPILLSLNPARRPRWAVSSDWLGRPSLEPSVRRTDGCRCHFWMRRGRIDWCKDRGGVLPKN
ncbi:DUF6527 family protein [Rhizobium leguminosarum]|uniref:DUF6527 family protein n=1 Tax=Rhizobium leguminosarum TaxID=384 RepID=UPI001C96CE98